MIIGLSGNIRHGFDRKLAAGMMAYTAFDPEVRLSFPTNSMAGTSIELEDCDGIVSMSGRSGAAAIKAGVPAVNTRVTPIPRCPQVTVDQRQVIGLMLSHLFERGIRRFAYVTNGSPLYLSDLRLRMLREHPFITNTNFSVHLQSKYQPGAPCVILDELRRLATPTGILVDGDSQGAHLLNALHQNGLECPAQYPVISVNNFTFVCNQTQPTLTSLDINIERIGYEATAMLVRMIRGAPPPPEPLFVPNLTVVPRESTQIRIPNNVLIDQAISYMFDRLGEPLVLEDIARHLSLSKRTFERRFVKAMKTPPMKYFDDMRLKQAKALLQKTDMNLEDVAKTCGYRSANYLCAVFRKQVGLTPATWRQRGEE